MALASLALAGFLVVFDAGATWQELEGVALAPFAVGLVAVFLAVVCWAETMRRVLLSAGGSVPFHRGVSAYATGIAIAGMIVAMTGVSLAVAGAIVVLYRICVYCFPVLIGLLAAVYTGTSVRSLDATIDR